MSDDQEVRPIREGVGGTYDTLKFIQQMGQAGAGNAYIAQFVKSFPLPEWDRILAKYWRYIPETEETLRSIPWQVESMRANGVMQGDCDDAAVVAVALATHAGNLMPFAKRIPVTYKIIAVRPPDQLQFEHVFVDVFRAGSGPYRVDPTAPENADYSGWQPMELVG